jgi:hypothetical protein
MTRASASYRFRFRRTANETLVPTPGFMKANTSYDQDLRAIGQALEIRGITVFDLKNQSGRYVVRGTPDKPSSVIQSMRRWMRGSESDASNTINYSAQEIEEIERQAKKKRVKSNRLPDFYNLSSTLRTLGAYLKSKDAQLLELHKGPLTVTLLYQNNHGHPHMEDRTIASFFNVFIEMHGRRNQAKS